MSTEHIDALIRSAEEDRALADELRHAGGLEKLVQIGAEHGYDFTQDELDRYLERQSAEGLSEQELGLVAGGTSNSVAAASSSSSLQYKLDRCFVKSWSTSGDA